MGFKSLKTQKRRREVFFPFSNSNDRSENEKKIQIKNRKDGEKEIGKREQNYEKQFFLNFSQNDLLSKTRFSLR